MAERSGGRPKPIDPELLKCQVAFKALSDEILQRKDDPPLTFFHLRINTDPAEILERLRQSPVRDLLLQDGESFSLPQPDDRYPDLGLIAGRAPLHHVSMTHYDWQEDKWRFDPESPNEPPYKIIRYPGEFDWTRQIVIGIWYGDGRTAQELSLYGGSRNAGVMPNISRAIYAMEYAEQGYEGHNHKHRRFRSQKESMFFINLARELFDKREQAH